MTLLHGRPYRAAFAWVCAFAVALQQGPLHAEAPAAGESSGEEGWTDLLSIDSLREGWRGYKSDDPPASWALEDGVLTGDGTGGDLVTRDEYKDFELEFEFRISPGGNSGVIYLASETGEHPYETGPEYQVLDPEFPGVDASTGPAALYALYPAPLSASKPAGEWNTGRIVVRDGAVEHWINGEKVVSAQIGSDEWNQRVADTKFANWEGFGKNKKGFLSLQDHGSRSWYRKLRIKRLGGADATQAGDKAAASEGTKRVLFVTQSAGFKHSTVSRQPHELSHSERVLTELGIRSGEFRVDCTQDVEADFTPELIANYDVVAFFTTGHLPIPEETMEWFLDEWLAEQGHGFLGVHAAADTYADYEPYWDMIGGTFDGHPWTQDQDVVLKVNASDHPASRPWGPTDTRIALKDEIYQFKNWQPEKVRVLMSLDMERTKLKKPRHVPVLWVKEYGAGRVMHMSLGHREDVWDNSQYQESLIGGLSWLLGVESGDATPNPELSAAEEELADEAFADAQPVGAP